MLIKEGSIKPEEADTERERHLYVMKVDRVPAPFWSLLVEISFFGWIGSVLFIILTGFSDSGRMNKKFVLYGIIFFSLNFTIWIVALIKA